MKRKDLTVGAELYYCSHNNWETYLYRGQKAVVVDTQPYRELEWAESRRRGVPYEPAAGGNRVLVDLHQPDRAEPERTTVLVAHLRGPYEQTRQQVADRVKRQRQARESADAAEQQARQARDAAVARAKTMDVVVEPVWSSTSGYVQMPAAQLQRLLDALASTESER